MNKYYKLIPYEVNDYGFTCKYFNFHPYYIKSFSTNTEDEMKSRIKEYYIFLVGLYSNRNLYYRNLSTLICDQLFYIFSVHRFSAFH